MADNFEDDKGKKKDSADFAQIMNVVNDIKGRVKDLNAVTFESLKSMLANVLDAYPEVAEFANIKEMFEQLELTLKEEEQRVKSAIVALINEENRAAEVKRIEEEAAEKAREEIERRAEVAGVYKAFDSLADEHVKEQEEDDKNLDKVLKAIEEGKPIDEETKKKLTKTPEQIEAKNRRWQHIDQTDKIADKEKKLHFAEIQNIKKLEEKVAHLPANHSERVSLANTRKYHEHHYGLAEAKKAKCEEYYDKKKKQDEKIRRGVVLAKLQGRDEEFRQMFIDRIQKIDSLSPEKIAQDVQIKTTEEKTITSSKDKVILQSQQKPDDKHIISNFDKESNKSSKDLTNKLIKNLSEGQKGKIVAGGSEIISPPPATPNKVKPTRLSID
jgi:hypothetical protein